MTVHGIEVYGVDLDAETRCRHYQSDRDIVAIKFACCGAYYACYRCHVAVVDHAPERWAREQFIERALLCGVCGLAISIAEYLQGLARCPRCRSAFNPGCALHHHLYFAIREGHGRPTDGPGLQD